MDLVSNAESGNLCLNKQMVDYLDSESFVYVVWKNIF